MFSKKTFHCKRAATIVDNNRGGIEGDVIGEVDLDELCVASITSIPRMPEIRTTHEFDGTTDCLVNILSGKYLQAPKEKKKRVPFLRRIFSRA